MLRTLAWMALAVCLATGAAFAQQANKAPAPPAPVTPPPPKPTLKVPLIKTAPTIDGVLDDAVWKEAAQGDIVKLSSGADSRSKARFLVMRGDKTLYVAVECFEDAEALKHLAAKVEQHDGFPMWEDDCVELFVDPTNQRQAYYHIIINSKNVLFDTYDTIPGSANNMGWDPDIKSAVKVGEKSWIVEMAMPYTAFDAESDSQTEWAFNLTRHSTALKENACWSPTITGSWHVPERFGTLAGMPKMNLFSGNDEPLKPRPGPFAPVPPQAMLFDFEDPAEAAGWSMLKLPESAKDEPAARVELSADHATSGKQALKITFDGGEWPAVATRTLKLPANVLDYQTLRLDVTASRPCLVAVRLLQERSEDGLTREAGLTRWNVSASLKEGLNEVRGELAGRDGEALSPKLGKVVAFAVTVYRPRRGDTITLDNVRLSTAGAWPKLTMFKVLGTTMSVSGIEELGARLNKEWKPPEAKSAAEVETQFAAQFADLRKTHPAARSVLLRQGQSGFDAAIPARPFDGWADTHLDARAPDGPNAERTALHGADEEAEAFMRHRGLLMRVDVSSIPKGSSILAARLLIQGRPTTPETGLKTADAVKPNLWVAEACNRAWVEGEANGYQYAADRLWKEAGGMNWDGDDPDFLPVFLAHGPAQTTGAACSWDFTEAVRFWTDGTRPNCGFLLHGDGFPSMRVFTRECKDAKLRPALLVVYEPK